MHALDMALDGWAIALQPMVGQEGQVVWVPAAAFGAECKNLGG